ncbi:PAS domain-containing protein [Daejeonella oryzae]|uniref:PAS domain-containing protein n=1 Tax=Daejeonella oryzae TaxID=1122943 RepID=UPI000404434B|nr:PAS domain-containing protein [Daejeonella oryzae]
MKLKQKLHAGFWFLFVVVIFFGALSLFYLRLISKSNDVILKDNYATLDYTNQMRTVLDENDIPLSPDAIEKFKSALIKEQKNITEKGENEAVVGLNRSFGILTNNSLGLQRQREAAREVLKYVGQIEKLNLSAIERKSQNSTQTIKKATIYLGVASAITFIVLFSFVFNLADFFEEPLRYITEGIEEISRKNYKTRLYFDRKDEFGDVSEAFNNMAQSLEKQNAENASIMTVEKLFTDAILKQSPDPVIGINNLFEIIFISPSAIELFDLDRKKFIGIKVSKLSDDNGPLRKIFTNNQSGSVIINNNQYQIEIQEIMASSNDLSELNTDLDIITSGKSVGKLYILKKQT